MAHAIDLRFQRFGRLIVLHRAPNKGDRVAWICQCDCGNLCVVRTSHLRRGVIVSCGCYRDELLAALKYIDLTGKQFGRWLVLGRADTIGGDVRWHVQCECGTKSIVFGNSLRGGWSVSCGCYHRERMAEVCSGENHYNWQGGKSYEPYCPKWTNELREHIRNKFGRRCVVCGKSEVDNNGYRLSVHHIDYDKQQGCSGRRWELVPLCHNCHTKTNGNRWYWYNLFHNFWVNSYTIPQ